MEAPMEATTEATVESAAGEAMMVETGAKPAKEAQRHARAKPWAVGAVIGRIEVRVGAVRRRRRKRPYLVATGRNALGVGGVLALL
jgi:hypothetical protein